MIKDGKYRYTLQFGMNTAEERLTSSVPLPTQAAANPRESVEQVSADILEMLNDLDSFG